MIRHKFFVTLVKRINLSINNLLKKNLNKLNLNNFFYIVCSRKFFLIFVTLAILFILYLSLPIIYNKEVVSIELKKQLQNKFNLDFKFTENVTYNFLPRPHFISEKSLILEDQNEISVIKNLKIYVSLKNLFSLKNMKVNDVILENANFNLNYQNYNFFKKLLYGNYKDSSLKIKDSNIFYRNKEKEVLFINRIKNMNYFYDVKVLQNIIISSNEVFNIPYSFRLYDNQVEKKIFTKINLNFLKLQIKNEINYNQDIKKGSTSLIFNKDSSNILYEISKDSLTFSLFDKLDSPTFLYEGKVNFNPFYSNLDGKNENIDFSFLFDANALIFQLFKTEILNKQNLNFNLKINGNKISNLKNLADIFFVFKIQEGLMDLDDTKFVWKDYANFEISESLLYVKNNELILDGKLNIKIQNSAKIYNSFSTRKTHRSDIKKIELNFNYNFDQKILALNDIKINDKLNQNINNILEILIFKNNKIRNNIYFKNIINKALKAYAG